MLHDFLPVINKIPVAEHPNKLTIIPLADAHYGSPEFNETRWHNTIRRIRDDQDCYAVLVGDLLDTALKSSVGDVYSATASPREQKQWLIDELKPIANKILAAVGGNHERRSIREVDNDPLYDVLLALGKEDVYRQNLCFMQVKLTYPTKDRIKQRYEFSFAITHGAGGGQYIGSSANRVTNWANSIEGVDCVISGHTHKPIAFPVSKLVYEGEHVITRQFVVAVASSFLDYGGYPVQKLLPPTAHTTTEIILTYSNGKKNIRVLQ